MFNISTFFGKDKLKEIAINSVNAIRNKSLQELIALIVVTGKSDKKIEIPLDAIYGIYGLGYGAAVSDFMHNAGYTQEDITEVYDAITDSMITKPNDITKQN